MKTKYVFNDGGRKAAGYVGNAGDCVTRAIAIATGKPYQEVYDALWSHGDEYINTRRTRAAKKLKQRGSTPRNGVYKGIYRPYIESLGWIFVPTMQIGSGCQVHLRADELPKGRLIVRVSKHLVAVIDGVIHDTHDCSRAGTRCVYGYWTKKRPEPMKARG